jgi:eukaryotic-like serine/threonine-protein kinase
VTTPVEQLANALSDRYRIERELGQGGMATVYLAEDVRHHRKVAVKVVHPELTAVLGADRFLSEIHVTATLQHPHILALFDSGQAEGQLFYVMPYIEGESLRARLDRERQLPVEESVRLTREVASALDYAHRHGVIHRDIKPENILLHDGQAIVADFGIALAVTKAGGGRLTQTGLSLGTPQYMSPEQATGERTIDARTDIYSLGAVVYEMLTGEPPHTGNSVQAIIARVLTERPRNIRIVRPNVPEHVSFAVERALEKLPADRWATAREFSDTIEGKAVGSATRSGARTSPDIATLSHGGWKRRLRDPLTLGLAVLALGATISAASMWATRRAPVERATVKFPLTLPGGPSYLQTTIQSLAISPDGSLIAFIGRGVRGEQQIYARSLSDPAARPLPGTEGAFTVFFSPDGKWLGFVAGGRLRKVAIDGGTALSVAAMPGLYGGAAWSGNGEFIYSMVSGGLLAFPENGGASRKICSTPSRPGTIIEALPLALPDGETVLFTSFTSQSNATAKLGAASLKTGKCTLLDVPGIHALGVADGLLIYATAEGTVMAVPYDTSRGRITGASTPVLTEVEVNQTTGSAQAAVSSNGSIVYASGLAPVSVVLADQSGVTQPLMEQARPYAYPRFSPDGRKIALTVATPGQRDIWVYDIPSGTSTRLTAADDGSVNERPEWTPDGKRVLYRTSKERRASIWWRPADLSEREAPLLTSDREDYFEAVMTPDARGIVYQLDTTGADVMYRQLSGDTVPKPIANSPGIESMARVSPDGRWVAYVSEESGRDQVIVQPFPTGPRTQVSIGGGREPVWSRDSRRLFYRDDQHFVAANVSATPSFSVTSRERLFEDSFLRAPFHANYDVSIDGSKLLLLKPTQEAQVMVVYNWIAEVRAKLAKQEK